jgi:hypothetical protein
VKTRAVQTNVAETASEIKQNYDSGYWKHKQEDLKQYFSHVTKTKLITGQREIGGFESNICRSHIEHFFPAKKHVGDDVSVTCAIKLFLKIWSSHSYLQAMKVKNFWLQQYMLSLSVSTTDKNFPSFPSSQMQDHQRYYFCYRSCQ